MKNAFGILPASLPALVNQPTVFAAGGVITRTKLAGNVEVLVVHRPRYDDWSFPKGKCEPGESAPDTAQREVFEETGVHVRLGPELSTVSSVDREGRPKETRYWLMTVERTELHVAGTEVDEVRWISPEEAHTLLTYASDRNLLEQFGDTT